MTWKRLPVQKDWKMRTENQTTSKSPNKTHLVFKNRMIKTVISSPLSSYHHLGTSSVLPPLPQKEDSSGLILDFHFTFDITMVWIHFFRHSSTTGSSFETSKTNNSRIYRGWIITFESWTENLQERPLFYQHYVKTTRLYGQKFKDKSDKEPGFTRLEKHRKNLILNASATIPFTESASKPTDFYPKRSQFKAKDMLLHQLHTDKISFNPSSSFINNLWNCDFFWLVPDSSSGVSIFFCPETKSSNAN